jgi:hypothetical protein
VVIFFIIEGKMRPAVTADGLRLSFLLV